MYINAANIRSASKARKTTLRPEIFLESSCSSIDSCCNPRVIINAGTTTRKMGARKKRIPRGKLIHLGRLASIPTVWLKANNVTSAVNPNASDNQPNRQPNDQINNKMSAPGTIMDDTGNREFHSRANRIAIAAINKSAVTLARMPISLNHLRYKTTDTRIPINAGVTMTDSSKPNR